MRSVHPLQVSFLSLAFFTGILHRDPAYAYLAYHILFTHILRTCHASNNHAVYQYTFEAKAPNGMKFEVPGICLYEFKNGKIQQHYAVVDRLLLAKQAAKGTVEKRLVGSMMKCMEKGLH